MRARTRIGMMALVVAVVGGIAAVGVGGAGEADAATQKTIHIPSSAFTPVSQAMSYSNNGLFLWGTTQHAIQFLAPVPLEGDAATVHSVTLHYYDNGSGSVCMWLRRPKPSRTEYKTMSTICSKNASINTRARTDVTINPNTIADTPPFIHVLLSGGANYRMYGVTIVYTSNP